MAERETGSAQVGWERRTGASQVEKGGPRGAGLGTGTGLELGDQMLQAWELRRVGVEAGRAPCVRHLGSLLMAGSWAPLLDSLGCRPGPCLSGLASQVNLLLLPIYKPLSGQEPSCLTDVNPTGTLSPLPLTSCDSLSSSPRLAWIDPLILSQERLICSQTGSLKATQEDCAFF